MTQQPGQDVKRPATSPIKGSDDDYHLRYKVVETGFSAQDDAIYEQAMAEIRSSVKRSVPWKAVVANLRVADAELKQIILDDFLKMTLAQRHFQEHVTLKQIANDLHVPVKLLTDTKQSMLREVEEASIKAYRLTKPEGTLPGQGAAGAGGTPATTA